MRHNILNKTHLEGQKMKKIGITLVLALVMVGAFAAVALADLSHTDPTYNAGPSATTYRYIPGTPGVALIHSNYAANTDACAACHAAHTAPGAKLLQWAGSASDACMACHDGTVAKVYDVVRGQYKGTDDGGATHRNNAGLFAIKNGESPVANSASEHAVFSGLSNSAAFGGSNPNDLVQNAGNGGTPNGTTDTKGKWTTAFTCTGCHNPHGAGGNGRLLNPNPNSIQTWKLATVVASTTDASTTFAFPGNDLPMFGYAYESKNAVVINGTTDSTAKFDWTNNGDGTVNQAIVQLTAPVANGTLIEAYYTPVLRVDMTIANKLTSQESLTYRTGINNFCGACHTDYNTTGITKPGSTTDTTLQGYYSKAYRHAVGKNEGDVTNLAARGLKFEISKTDSTGTIACITCHYSHGVDQTLWAANGGGNGVWNNPEISGSSRLKRGPNMGVCEACHDKGQASYSFYTQANYR